MIWVWTWWSNSKSLVSLVCERSNRLFKIKRWGKPRASAGACWPEDILTAPSYQSLWAGSATSVMQRTSWCDSQSFLWSCMYKMLLWLSVITLLTPQYCICYQIWHENTTDVQQWSSGHLNEVDKNIITYTFLLLMAHLLNALFLLNDILNGPCPKQLQTKKKNLLNTLAPKKKTQRRPAEGALTERSASSVLQAAAWPALVQKDRLSLSFPWWQRVARRFSWPAEQWDGQTGWRTSTLSSACPSHGEPGVWWENTVHLLF